MTGVYYGVIRFEMNVARYLKFLRSHLPNRIHLGLMRSERLPTELLKYFLPKPIYREFTQFTQPIEELQSKGQTLPLLLDARSHKMGSYSCF